jgi:hypothetical protein
MDSPARQSRWIAAYSSTLDLGCTSATSSRRARQCSHRKPRSSVTSQRHRLAAETIAVAGDRQTLSLVADRTTAGIRRTRRAGQMYMSSTSAGGRVRHVAGGDTSWGVAPAAPDRPRRPYPAEEASNLPACEAGQRSGRLVRRPTTACSPLASHHRGPWHYWWAADFLASAAVASRSTFRPCSCRPARRPTDPARSRRSGRPHRCRLARSGRSRLAPWRAWPGPRPPSPGRRRVRLG